MKSDQEKNFNEEFDCFPIINKYKEPPFHEMVINFPIDEIPSIQSKNEFRKKFDSQIAKELKKFEYIFTGEVKLFVEIPRNSIIQYHTDMTRDLDNILKPLIDSLCGPDRIIVDDNRIQTLSINWLDMRVPSFKIHFVYYGNDFFEKKTDLVFVELFDKLYLPMSLSLTRKQKIIMLSGLAKLLKAYKKTKYTGCLPIEHLYHKSRIIKFKYMRPWQYIKTSS